jgi:hypothetical protein
MHGANIDLSHVASPMIVLNIKMMRPFGQASVDLHQQIVHGHAYTPISIKEVTHVVE